MQDVIEYYKNFDVSQANEVKPKFLQKLHSIKNQQGFADSEQISSERPVQRAIDSDILAWITSQDQPIIDDINTLLRLYMRARVV